MLIVIDLMSSLFRELTAHARCSLAVLPENGGGSALLQSAVR